MAILMRRGVMVDFDPRRMKPGEWAVVLDGDDTPSGKGIYMCFEAGTVKKIATLTDLSQDMYIQNQQFIQQVTASIDQTESDIQAAEALRAAAEQDRDDAEEQRIANEQSRVTAEQGRVTAEQSRVTEEARRVAEFAQMEQRAQGWVQHYCTTGEYDPTTRRPTIADPDSGTLYYVPVANPTTDNRWTEWTWDAANSRWEVQGSTVASVSSITTAEIDSVVADENPSGGDMLDLSGLSYLWAKIKLWASSAYASISHMHSQLHNSSGTAIVRVGGTGVAEGVGTTALGENSRAQNLGTQATGSEQTALGRYNLEDQLDEYAVIVGNGTASSSSNALTLDWQGNAWAAGDIEDGSGNVLSQKANSSHTHVYTAAPNTVFAGPATGSASGDAAFRSITGDDLPAATASSKGTAKVGTGLQIDSNDVLSVPPATTSTLGGVKPDGTTVTVDADGTIHSAGSSSKPYQLWKPDGSAVVVETTASYGVREGYSTTASGTRAHAEGSGTKATGDYAHAEGVTTTASGGYGCHAEGYGTTASGIRADHAEGQNTTASGGSSHAEGAGTEASGGASHAEGAYTVASGSWTHAAGYYTIAQRGFQTVVGEYNIADTGGDSRFGRGDYALIVGNGNQSNARSNALGVRWDGTMDVGNMASVSGDNHAYPLFIWTSSMTNPESYTGTYPVSPCFVYYVPNNGLYYCTN